jgi:hypothetical protein
VETTLELECFPPAPLRVATDELAYLRQEAAILRALQGIDPAAPLPQAARVSPRFRYLAKDSAYLRDKKRYHT